MVDAALRFGVGSSMIMLMPARRSGRVDWLERSSGTLMLMLGAGHLTGFGWTDGLWRVDGLDYGSGNGSGGVGAVDGVVRVVHEHCFTA